MLGVPAAPELVRLLVSATAGLPFLLRAASRRLARRCRPPIGRPARFALIERLRRLDGAAPRHPARRRRSVSDLGPDDVAAALRLSSGRGAGSRRPGPRQRARSSPSHHQAFLRTVHRRRSPRSSARQGITTSRSRCCDSQLELSTLTADLALRMAEHGLRDERLATALTDLAVRTDGQPARAARLYRAAADAGATALSAQLADALALTGDCATAGRLADELLVSPDPARARRRGADRGEHRAARRQRHASQRPVSLARPGTGCPRRLPRPRSRPWPPATRPRPGHPRVPRTPAPRPPPRGPHAASPKV